MHGGEPFGIRGKLAVLATMHGKEQAISPVLEAGLGIRISVPQPFDTDRFGTFTGDIERKGSQIDSARAKLKAAREAMPEAAVAIASEGSFGPHPEIPFVAVGRELVILHDRETDLEILGYHLDLMPCFDHFVTGDVAAGMVFAERVGFPRQGVVVTGARGGAPAPDLFVAKTIDDHEDLAAALDLALAICGEASVATDMRAHRNPTRMASIRRAAEDLVDRHRQSCPACGHPGFAVERTLSGLPCAWCGAPTLAKRADLATCRACGFSRETAVAVAAADPGACPFCNP